MVNKHDLGTYIESEALCTDKGQFRRKFRARHVTTHQVVSGMAAQADTFFSIPATTATEHGFLSLDFNVLEFYPHSDQSMTPAQYRKDVRKKVRAWNESRS